MEADRLRKYYSRFESREIGDLVINIAPTKNDIPVLEVVGFDEPTRCFVISFKLENENSKLAFRDDILEIHVGMNTNKIAKIVVKNVDRSNIRAITLLFETTLDRFERELLKDVNSISPIEDRLRKIGNYDIIDRQLKETKDIFEESSASAPL
jgi:hypothetical protein